MQRRCSPRSSWLTVILAASVLETWALRNKRHDATLSYLTRHSFRTNTVLGRAVFVTSWTVLSVWFVPHVLDYEREKSVQAKP